MIIDEKVKDLVIVGEDTSKKAKISQDKLAKLQYLLTKGLYKDPITAVIAEWTNNGIDSVVQAGKNPIENPVVVSINKDSNGQYAFKVEDKGIGLDDRDFEDICMNYLESTKETDNDTIGHFGIGMKSFLSLERSATFTCRKNGIERKYLVYEGSEFVNFDLIYAKETNEGNGVIAELVINNWSEKNQFVDKAKMKLSYYDTVVLIVDGQIVENNIHRNELFQWSTLCTSSLLHVCLKDVYYEIDYSALGISALYFPVAIRLNLGDGLTPTPSRESYITNDKTKQLLLDKIHQIADWFIDKYNETVKEFATFKDAYDYLGNNNYSVTLGEKKFDINYLKKYSKKTLLSPKVKGIELRNPLEYKHTIHDMFLEYDIIGYTNYGGTMQSKRLQYMSIPNHLFNRSSGKVVLVGANFRGNIKEYLKKKHGNDVLYVRRNTFEYKVGTGKNTVLGNGQVKVEDDTYRHFLNLSVKPKDKWRGFINEFNYVKDSCISTFIDETKIEADQAFLNWVEQKKAAAKANKTKSTSTYSGLNKQEGDVTMAYGYKRYGRVYFTQKQAIPIKTLRDNKFLTVLLTEDDNLTLIKNIAEAIPDDLAKTLKFALVGKKEIKKIPKHFQFVNFEQFMSRDCKPFMRLASAIKFREVLENLSSIKNYKNPVFAKALKTLKEDEIELTKYANANFRYGIADDMRNMIIDVADEHNLYDMQLWDVYKRLKENVAKYDFITLIHVPSSTNADLTSRYETLINQILLFRKKFYNDLQGAKIVFEENN